MWKGLQPLSHENNVDTQYTCHQRVCKYVSLKQSDTLDFKVTYVGSRFYVE